MRSAIAFLLILTFACKEQYEVPNHTPGVVKVIDGMLFVAYGEGGLVLSNESTGEVLAQIFPPQGMNSIDDFDVDDNLIFVLDSRNRDYLAVFSYEDGNVALVSSPVPVQGGPFNGISASNGNLVVSGGTTFLNRFTYSSNGELSGPVNFGRDRGHPDVILSNDGQVAFVSTDFVGGENGFGVSSLFLGDALQIPFIISELRINGAGFTPGVTSPVGFPIQTFEHNNHLIVAHGGGMTFIDLLDGYSFGSDQSFDIGISGISVTVDSDIAYITGIQDGAPALVRIDLSDMSNPSIIGTENLSTNGTIPTSIAVGTTNLYITSGNLGIIVLPKN